MNRKYYTPLIFFTTILIPKLRVPLNYTGWVCYAIGNNSCRVACCPRAPKADVQTQEAGHFHEKKVHHDDENSVVHQPSTCSDYYILATIKMLASCTLPWTKSVSSELGT